MASVIAATRDPPVYCSPCESVCESATHIPDGMRVSLKEGIKTNEGWTLVVHVSLDPQLGRTPRAITVLSPHKEEILSYDRPPEDGMNFFEFEVTLPPRDYAEQANGATCLESFTVLIEWDNKQQSMLRLGCDKYSTQSPLCWRASTKPSVLFAN